MKLAALYTMLPGSVAWPPSRIDRLAVIRVAKDAIQDGQQQQQLYESYPLPRRPAQAQVPRPTASMSTDQPVTPLSSNGSSSSGEGGGSPSGNSIGGGGAGVEVIADCGYVVDKYLSVTGQANLVLAESVRAERGAIGTYLMHADGPP